MTDNKLVVKNKELQEYFKQKFVLTEDIAKPVISLPILKLVYQAQGDEPKIVDGKMVREIDGQDVPVGSFYHSETKKFYDSPEIVIMHYIKAKLPSYEKPEILKHNEIIGGWMVEDKTPFMFFMKSLALSDWWDFCGDLAETSRSSQIPTYGIIAKLTTGKKSSLDGKYKNIMIPQVKLTGKIMTDLDTLKLIEDGLEKTREGLRAFVDYKMGEVVGEQKNKGEIASPALEADTVTEDDIPF